MDAAGIIRQIEADPALRAQLRAVLLGDEVLAMPVQLAQLAESQRRMQDELGSLRAVLQRFMEATEARLGRLESDVSTLKGSDLERRLREDPARWVPDRFRRIKLLRGEDLEDLIEKLERHSPLDPRERRRLLQTDLVAEARDTTSNQRVTLVGEVSVTLHEDDVERVAASAEILARRAMHAYPLVIGIDPGAAEVAREAERRGVEVVAVA